MYLPEVIDYNRSGLHELQTQPEIPWGNTVEDVVYDPRLEAGLDSVLRWHNGVIHPPEGLIESDLGHVQSMEAIFQQVLTESPFLEQEISKKDVDMMIRIHDMGEILMGDIPPIMTKDPVIKQWKDRSEPLAVTMMTRNLQEPAKSDIRYYHHRYEVRDTKDKEAMTTKWLDVVQGNRFALGHGLYETILSPEEQEEHVVARLTDMFKWTKALVSSLDTQAARTDVFVFAGGELETFYEQGYERFVDQAIEQFPTLPQ